MHYTMRLGMILLSCLAGSLLLAGCDQSVNISDSAESKLTGKYCDAKNGQEASCKAGDIVLTVADREHLLCDWGWQIDRQQGTDSVVCVYRGEPRGAR